MQFVNATSFTFTAVNLSACQFAEMIFDVLIAIPFSINTFARDVVNNQQCLIDINSQS